MIEEMRRVLAAIIQARQDGDPSGARDSIAAQIRKLTGCEPAEAVRLSETELHARLIHGESTHAVPEKTVILAALFKEAGETAEAENQPSVARSYRLKALELLLGTPESKDPAEVPDFIPRVETLAALLADEPLPIHLEAGLVYHYERTGAFARAENSLHALLEQTPGNQTIIEFGVGFYERLLQLNPSTLESGGMTRAEAEAGLEEWKRQRPFESQRAAGNG